MAYTHITHNERRSIERFMERGESLRNIAKKLSRSVSSISAEIRKNSVKGVYGAKKAEHKSRQRRKKSKIQCLKVSLDKDLKEYVRGHIKNSQSPEGISLRLKYIDTHLPYASTKAIYKFIYSPAGRDIEKYLYSRAVKRKGGPKRGKRVVLDGRRMIDERPEEVDERLQFGHFEGDFIESGKDGKGHLFVLYERKTRYPFLSYLENKETETVNREVERLLRSVPLLSLTLDNDLSFQKHEDLEEMIKALIYFTHPYSSWQKGGVENRNKAIRRYIKKSSDLSSYTEDFIREVEKKLRNKFIVCLNGKSPQESWDEEIERYNAKVLKKTAGKRLVLKDI